MYAISCDTTIDGTVDSVWATWTDMASYPEWDPREESLRIDGPFEAGTTGFSKQVGGRPGADFRLTLVEPEERWKNELPLPGGRLVIDHWLSPTDDGRLHVIKRYEVHGPMSLPFRLFFARGIKEGAALTFAALEAEAARRAAR